MKSTRPQYGGNYIKKIATPDIMWELFQNYCVWVKANPIHLEDYVGGAGKKVIRNKPRPMTIEGFRNFLYIQGIIGSIQHYFSNHENKYDEYIEVVDSIKSFIRADQIEGGMTGIYNPSITQRLNGLVDKIQEDGTKEITIKVKYERKGIDGETERTALGAAESIEREEEV